MHLKTMHLKPKRKKGVKNMSRIAKFFIICGAVFILGIGLVIAGFATGGLKDIDNISDKYDWLDCGPGNIQTEHKTALEFNSINVEGSADVIIADPSEWTEVKNLIEDEGEASMTTAEAGDVVTCWGENYEKPDVKVEEGVLKINSKSAWEDGGHISMNFTSDDGIPDIIIICPDSELTSIKVNNQDGDTDIYGVKFASGDITTANGDIDLASVTCRQLNITNSNGDVGLDGTFTGDTSVKADEGDVEFNTSASRADYSIDIQTENGDVTDSGNSELGPVYRMNGGQNMLKLRTVDGDIDLTFGDA